jgi:hypothetical protein
MINVLEDEPRTMEEAREARRVLRNEIEEIKAQLGDRIRRANAPL